MTIISYLQSMTFSEDKDPALVDMIARWVIAMPYVLKAHVTEVKDLSVQLQVHSQTIGIAFHRKKKRARRFVDPRYPSFCR